MTVDTEVAQAPLDLSVCEAEPIHLAGAIQPHGVLLALTIDGLEIVQATPSCRQHLGIEVADLLGRPLADALGMALVDLVREGSRCFRCQPTEPVSFRWTVPSAAEGAAAEFTGYVHEASTTEGWGLLVLELLPVLEQDLELGDALGEAVRGFQPVRVQAELDKKLQTAAELFRRLTGYDRVMIYRFDELDWHGEVVAESKTSALSPYLGLHFPASDIPAQARHLYVVNRTRVIVDANYVPSPLMASAKAPESLSLDLSLSLLRSVSPVHREYMRNMGVAASLTLSLLRDGELWGLIACHHRSPRPISLEVREIADWMAQDLSTQITLSEQNRRRRERANLKQCREQVLQAMRQGARLTDVVRGPGREDLLCAVDADGVALVRGREVVLGGQSPPESQVLEILERLRELRPAEMSPLFVTDCLSEHLPDMAAWAGQAAGVAMLSFDAVSQLTLLWFRGEQLRKITWGGDPDKAAELSNDGRINPRKSFEQWSQTVRFHSHRWWLAQRQSALELGGLIDIELRKDAEERLHRTEIVLKAAIETIGEGFVVYDAQDRLVHCNREYRNLYRTSAPVLEPGRSFEEILRYGLARGQYPEAVGREEEWLKDRLREHHKDSSEILQQLDDDRWLKVRERRTPDGFHVGIRVDVTELHQARLAAESANIAKSRFVATISHEIRTPLNGITGMAQLLARPDINDAERVDYANTLLNSSKSLLALLNDILDLSKVEAGKLKIDAVHFKPAILLRELHWLFSESVRDKGLTYTVVWNDDSPGRFYRADAHRLRQMLINLVNNAIKFTVAGFVRIEGRELPPADTPVSQPDSRKPLLEFAVVDSGPGIPADRQRELFQPFSQIGSSTARLYGGTGLGLSIVKRLARLMGGEAGVESEEGQGARFWLRIPAERVSEADAPPLTRAEERGQHLVGSASAESRPNTSQPKTSAKPQPGRERPTLKTGASSDTLIFVVDDEPTNRKLMRALLSKLNFSVVEADNGQQCVDRLNAGLAPDVILMDCRMPELDGYQATQAIRAAEQEKACPRVPVIALTAAAYAEDRERAMAAGMDDMLAKPVMFEELSDKLAEWLAKA
ncbi:response regulator [Thiorhodovibrio frisius]|uniref:histidine kinase n=1 Tax=Thiorhodovibrio frisius TaxID=631362 RepID=H8Z583_9GAMM|nr:response regulator [Thiorhodovibrio frisius]EIC20490.1 bacteriophytochrome (light-regulated signal transduction histidine kinase) [Thiorhodovibrio frisius]WPL21231.1 Phytochrome-like protein cph1 [Thiorhodovibrio frisius]